MVLGQSVLFRSDISTVVAFIVLQGDLLSLSLCRLALDLWGCVFLVRFTSSLPSSRKEVSSVNLSFQREVNSSLSLGFEVFGVSEVLPSGVPPPPLGD